jgi:hypothetical protein
MYRTGHRVTVQDIRRDLAATPGLVDRLADIGRRAANLRDPHLLAVYNLVESAGVLQLVAEWSDAPTVAALRRGRQLAPEVVVLIVDGVVAGLEVLHQEGLFHGCVGADTVVVEPGSRGRLAELAVCAAAAPPGAGPDTDLGAAATLGLELLHRAGSRLDPVRRALASALGPPGSTDAARLRADLDAASTAVFGGGWRERAGTGMHGRRPRRRRWILGVAALAVIAIAGGATAGILLSGGRAGRTAPAGPLAIGSNVVLTVAPARGGCDTTFVFVARDSLSGAGTLVYRWEQSDGQSTADTSLPITPDEGSFQLTQAWRIQGAQTLDGAMTLHILKPVDRSVRQAFRYSCS